jgi:hypothetical protein
MDLDVLIGDSVNVAEAKIYVQGGGWNMITVAGLPVRVPRVGLAASLRLSRAEMSASHQLLIRLIDPDGVPFALAGGVDGKSDGLAIELPAVEGQLPEFISEMVHPRALNLDGLEFTKSGIHHFSFLFDGREVRRVNLHVVTADMLGNKPQSAPLTGQYL